MPPPAIPTSVDGVSMDTTQRKRLSKLATLIWRSSSSRAPESVRLHAISAWRLTVRRAGRKWIDLTRATVGSGSGPTVAMAS